MYRKNYLYFFKRKLLSLPIAIVKSRLFKLGTASTVAFATYIGMLHLNDNFHEVIPDQLYRSGQLEPGELTQLAKRHGIKSVLNLRGENKGSGWYDNEVNEAANSGVKHLDFRMSAKRELSSGQVNELVAIMRDAPKPLLIHCEGGADRSGLAAAIYVEAINKRSTGESENQLSLRYGHFPSLSNDRMCQTFDAAKMLLSRGS